MAKTRDAKKRGTVTSTRRKGGRARATRALITREEAAKIEGPDMLRAYWDPRLHDTAPALRTSFGNFTTVNAVARHRNTTSTSVDTWYMFRWTGTDCMALYWGCAGRGAAGGGVVKVMNPFLTTGLPLAVRPLRMGMRLFNNTSVMNRGGLVYVSSVDSGFDLTTESIASSGAQVTFNIATMTSLYDLVENGLDTQEIPVEKLASGVSVVSAPASYPVYNHYNDFAPMSQPANVFLSPAEASSLLFGQPSPTSYPATLSTLSADQNEDSAAQVPAMRTIFVLLKATTAQNEYMFEFCRQDGCRFPVNSLGHSFSVTHEPCDAGVETQIMKSVQRIAGIPGGGFTLTELADRMHTIGNAVGGAVSSIGSAIGAAKAFSADAAYSARAGNALRLLSKGVSLL